MTKFFKNSEKPWGHFGPFLPKFRQKINFPGKGTLSVVTYSNYLPLCQKSEKTNRPFPRKKTDNSDFIGPSVHIHNQFVLLHLQVLIGPHMFSS